MKGKVGARKKLRGYAFSYERVMSSAFVVCVAVCVSLCVTTLKDDDDFVSSSLP
jgi:hypothetical protein